MSTWGILGCGTIASEMAETFRKMGREIYGISNRTVEKAEKFAETYGVKHVFKTYEEMLAAVGPGDRYAREMLAYRLESRRQQEETLLV